MEQELFGQVLDQDELLDELDKLDADMADLEIPNAGIGMIEVDNKEGRVENHAE